MPCLPARWFRRKKCPLTESLLAPGLEPVADFTAEKLQGRVEHNTNRLGVLEAQVGVHTADIEYLKSRRRQEQPEALEPRVAALENKMACKVGLLEQRIDDALRTKDLLLRLSARVATLEVVSAPRRPTPRESSELAIVHASLLHAIQQRGSSPAVPLIPSNVLPKEEAKPEVKKESTEGMESFGGPSDLPFSFLEDALQDVPWLQTAPQPWLNSEKKVPSLEAREDCDIPANKPRKTLAEFGSCQPTISWAYKEHL